jgi:hypothetical protein
VKLIIDLDSNFTHNDKEVENIILTSNIFLKGKNIINIDFSVLDHSSETADAINYYFKALPSSFLPFRNDFYMKVFRPIFAVIHQIEKICSNYPISTVILNGGANFPFITLFHGGGEGTKKCFKNSWLINYFIHNYFKNRFTIQWNKTNKSLLLLLYFFREFVFIFLRLLNLTVKLIFSANSKEKLNLDNYKYFAFVKLPLQKIKLSNTLSFIDSDKILFISKNKLNSDSNTNLYVFQPRLKFYIKSIKKFINQKSLKKDSFKINFRGTKINLKSIYIKIPLFFDYINFYTDLNYLKTYIFNSSFSSKPILITNMTFGSDIIFVNELSNEINGKHINYQSVGMSIMHYPKIKLADNFYMYTKKSYDFYFKLDSTYKFYLPVFEDLKNKKNHINEKLIVTVFTQPDSFTYEYLDFLKNLDLLIKKSNLKVEVLIKLHYRQDKVNLFNDLIINTDNFKIVKSDTNLSELFSYSDFIISITSAVLFEAFQNNCLGIAFDFSNNNTKFIDINSLPEVNFKVNDYDSLLDMLRYPQKYQALYNKRRINFLNLNSNNSYQKDLIKLVSK